MRPRRGKAEAEAGGWRPRTRQNVWGRGKAVRENLRMHDYIDLYATFTWKKLATENDINFSFLLSSFVIYSPLFSSLVSSVFVAPRVAPELLAMPLNFP